MTLSLADFQGQLLPGFRRHPANIVLGGVRGGVNGAPTFFVTAARLSA